MRHDWFFCRTCFFTLIQWTLWMWRDVWYFFIFELWIWVFFIIGFVEKITFQDGIVKGLNRVRKNKKLFLNRRNCNLIGRRWLKFLKFCCLVVILLEKSSEVRYKKRVCRKCWKIVLQLEIRFTLRLWFRIRGTNYCLFFLRLHYNDILYRRKCSNRKRNSTVVCWQCSYLLQFMILLIFFHLKKK